MIAETLTYAINPGKPIDFGTGSWQLTLTMDGHSDWGYDGIGNTCGYTITTSKMGHLYYAEPGNPEYGLMNTAAVNNFQGE